MNEPNPYGAPMASLESLDTDQEGFRLEPRRLHTGAALDWLGESWRLFSQGAGTWIGVFVLFFLLVVVVSVVPLVGGIAANLLSMVMMGGIALGCDAQRRGAQPDVGLLFSAWNAPSRNPLLLLGLLYLLATMVVVVVMVVVMFVVFGGMGVLAGNLGENQSAAAVLPAMILFAIAMVLLILPLSMAIWLAPPLVALNGVAPIDAMKASFFACLRNLDVVVVFGLVAIVVTLVALLPLGLGLLVTSPMMMISSYVAYRQMFYDQP